MDQRFKMLVNVREDRFRWHEQERGILRFAGNEIFVGHILDMHFHVAAELCNGGLACLRVFRFAHGIPCFKREFCVDHQRW